MKNLVICCDGTRGEFGAADRNTNVVRLFGRLADREGQFVYYDPGVGTYSSRRTAAGQWLRNSAASMFGSGLKSNALEAYRYLMTHYQPGDRIFLFGYSRGAHTVRVLAGMLFKCGLLMKGSENLIPYMARIYFRKNNDQVAEDFKRHFSRGCPVRFIGVWDTVASMGFLWRRRYYRNNILNPGVSFAFQALSIDERRWQFQPSIWNEDGIPEGQTIEQVWFAGRHADVGGQDVPGRGVSDIPLQWMLEKAGSANLLLLDDWQKDLNPDPCAQFKKSWVTSLWGIVFRKARDLPADARIHESVFERLENTGCGYNPGNLNVVLADTHAGGRDR